MAQLFDITRLVDRLGELQSELALEVEAGGDLQICRRRADQIESIAATLSSAFQSTAEIIVDQVRTQFPAAPAA